MSPALRRHAFGAARIGLTVAILAVLWHALDGRAALGLLAGADLAWLAAGVATLTLQTLLSALRWRLTAAQLGISIAPVRAIREYYLAQIVNQSLPGGMVGDAGRAVRVRQEAGLGRSALAVVLERFTGQVAMVVVLAGAFAVTWAVPGGLDWPAWVAGPLALTLGAGAVVVPLLFAAGARLPGAAGRGAARATGALRTAVLAPCVLPRQIALSLGTVFCNLAAFAACARAVGVPLPLGAVLALVPLILLTMLIPILVSGWGVREGAAAALFPLAGAGATEGFAASLAFGLVFLVTALPGLGVLLSPRAEVPQEATGRPALKP